MVLAVVLLTGTTTFGIPVRAEDNSTLFAPAVAADPQLVSAAALAALTADTDLFLASAGTTFSLPASSPGEAFPEGAEDNVEVRYRAALNARDVALWDLAALVSRPEGVPVLVAEWQALSRSQRATFLTAVSRAGFNQATREVALEECPRSAPEGTLRGGAAVVGVYDLCVRSVLAAPTPQAATAIRFTFANLGARYSVERRNQQGYFDCSSYVMRAYAAAGLPAVVNGGSLTTRTIAPYPGYLSVPWLQDVEWDDRRPGDLLLTPPNRADGGGHVMVVLVDGFVIHTATEGDVAHIRTEYPRGRIEYIRRVSP
jgi:cell wall-associated NlpC family hydrolase